MLNYSIISDKDIYKSHTISKLECRSHDDEELNLINNTNNISSEYYLPNIRDNMTTQTHRNLCTPSPNGVFGKSLWDAINATPPDTHNKINSRKRKIQKKNGPQCNYCKGEYIYECCPGQGRTSVSKHEWKDACCLVCKNTNGESHSEITFCKHTLYKDSKMSL